MRALALTALCAALAGCPGAEDQQRPDPPTAATVRGISPTVLLVGTAIEIDAVGYTLDAEHTLEIATAAGAQVSLPLQVVEGRVGASLDQAAFDTLGVGKQTVTARIRSRNSWGETLGDPGVFGVELVASLSPSVTAIGDGLVHLNDPVAVEGQGLLLGGAEGRTAVELSGCFLPAGQPASCATNGTPATITIDLGAVDASRGRGSFSYPAKLAGVRPGRFSGTLALVNYQKGKPPSRSAERQVTFDVQRTTLTGLNSGAVSLGEFLQIQGRGFVGGEGSTLLEFDGSFKPSSGGLTRPVKLAFVTGFVDGQTLRYVLEEENGIGAAVDLRDESGTLSGTWTPVVSLGSEQQVGSGVVLALEIGAVKQVVHLRFLPSWQEALRAFGLQPADQRVRDRIFTVVRRAYQGINVEIRAEQPDDFGLYAIVDIGGPDPNGLGLLGYDNTPGKDVENKRLFDHVGGVNALTQEDGYPGYGGIFASSQLAFSEHPPAGMAKSPLHTPLFDQIFDSVRPDRGREVTSEEVAAAPSLKFSAGCPATDRVGQVACAIFVLGNIIGHTAAHELGHSFGLAEPYGAPTTYHNPGDVPNRLMEGGSGRPFAERAELAGQGPAVFCDDEYAYLQLLMPTGQADPLPQRPSCY